MDESNASEEELREVEPVEMPLKDPVVKLSELDNDDILSTDESEKPIGNKDLTDDSIDDKSAITANVGEHSFGSDSESLCIKEDDALQSCDLENEKDAGSSYSDSPVKILDDVIQEERRERISDGQMAENSVSSGIGEKEAIKEDRTDRDGNSVSSGIGEKEAIKEDRTDRDGNSVSSGIGEKEAIKDDRTDRDGKSVSSGIGEKEAIKEDRTDRDGNSVLSGIGEKEAIKEDRTDRDGNSVSSGIGEKEAIKEDRTDRDGNSFLSGIGEKEAKEEDRTGNDCLGKEEKEIENVNIEKGNNVPTSDMTSGSLDCQYMVEETVGTGEDFGFDNKILDIERKDEGEEMVENSDINYDISDISIANMVGKGEGKEFLKEKDCDFGVLQDKSESIDSSSLEMGKCTIKSEAEEERMTGVEEQEIDCTQQVPLVLQYTEEKAALAGQDTKEDILNNDEDLPQLPNVSEQLIVISKLKNESLNCGDPDVLLDGENLHGSNKADVGNEDEKKSGTTKTSRKHHKRIPKFNRGSQTAIQLLESSVFRDFSLDFLTKEVEIGFMTVDALQELDPSVDEWPALLVAQLNLRDNMINILNGSITDLLTKGRRLEEDIDYLRLKILDLEQQVKKKNKRNAATQTVQDLSTTWNTWYPGHNYYAEYGSYGWGTGYVQHQTISSGPVITYAKASEEKSTTEHEGIDAASQPHIPNCSTVNAEADSVRRDVSEEALEAKSGDKDDDCRPSEAHEDVIDNTAEADTVNGNHRKPETLVSKENERQLPENTEKALDSAKKSDSHGWDVTEAASSITEQVRHVAATAVEHSGYIFQEELGLYYDYNTGYYYNAENSLYYDPKTGTYFYYDHSSQSYQFHSQVPVEDQSAILRKRGSEQARVGEADSDQRAKKKLKKGDGHEKEEGECTDSDDEGDDVQKCEEEEVEEKDQHKYTMEEEELSEICHDDNQETTKCPPSLRLMVVESDTERVKVGSLHLVTVDGGTIGREAQNLVQIIDISISKVHAAFTYISNGPDDHHYYVKDLGSNNGTYVNGTRLSHPRQTSQPVEIGHGWTLQFGPVKLKCHIHPGQLTCNECEPGLVISSLPSQSHSDGGPTFKNAKSREKARKKEMKALRKKYALSSCEDAPPSNSDYLDRAVRRRKVVGSDNPYEKTEIASCDVALRENNKGYTLLKKMGWSQGQSLGKCEGGITEPIQPEIVVGRVGLGSTDVVAPNDPSQQQRKRIIQLTQKRYNQT